MMKEENTSYSANQPKATNRFSDLFYFTTFAIIILGVSYVIFSETKPKFVFTYGININATLDNLLTQQSNVISWFTVIATFILSIMGAITAYGYFNTKEVTVKMKNVETLEKSIRNSKQKIDHVKLFFDHLHKIQNDISVPFMPCSILLPKDFEIIKIKQEIIKIKILEYAGCSINDKQIFVLALGMFYDKDYNGAIHLINAQKSDEESLLFSFLSGMCYYQKGDYYLAINKFIKTIIHQNEFGLAYWYMVNALLSGGNMEDEASFNTMLVNTFKDKVRDFIFVQNVMNIYRLLLIGHIDFDQILSKIEDLLSVNPFNGFLQVLKHEILAQEAQYELSLRNLGNSESVDSEEYKRVLDENIKDAIKKGKRISHYMRYQEPIYQDFRNNDESSLFLESNKVYYGNSSFLKNIY